MSHRIKLEQVLEYIINEDADQEAASDLLHQIVVEKARAIYEELVDGEEELDEDDTELDEAESCDDDEEEELEEAFGGDMKDDFASDIASDEDEIDSEEKYDDSDEESEEGAEEFGGDEFGGEEEGEGEVEDRVEDLEAALADLRSEFDRLMGEEMDEPYHDEVGGEDEFAQDDEFGDEEMAMEPEVEGYYEGVSEATKFQDDVSDPGMGQEGKYSGTGAKSKDAPGAGKKEAPYTNAPAKQNYGGKVTDFAKKAGDGKQVDKSAKKDAVEDNIDVPEKSQSADLKGEGKFSGTGKNSKKGQTFTKSPLTKKPS